jgi:hypothetical protein
MANAFRFSNAAVIAGLNAELALLNVGGPGSIKIYTGSAPTNVEDAATGTLLGTLTYSATAFPTAVDANPGALATASAIASDVSADAAGTAGYFRMLAGNGTTGVAQGTCGTSSADMVFNSVAISAGAIIAVTSQTVTLPEI